MRPIALVALALGPMACGGAIVTAPKTAAPVLIGPVDRVGGHRAPVAPADAKPVVIDAQAGFFVYGVGPYVLAGRYDNGARAAAVSLFDATGGKDDCDVHVESLKTGSWASGGGSWVAWHDEGTLRGTVRKVSR